MRGLRSRDHVATGSRHAALDPGGRTDHDGQEPRRRGDLRPRRTVSIHKRPPGVKPQKVRSSKRRVAPGVWLVIAVIIVAIIVVVAVASGGNSSVSNALNSCAGHGGEDKSVIGGYVARCKDGSYANRTP